MGALRNTSNQDRLAKSLTLVISVACALGAGNMRSPTVAKRSIYFGGRKTSATLEEAFWQGLREIAHRRRMTMSDLVGEIAAQHRQSNLSSALRLYVLRFYRSQIPDDANREGVR
jgi:predicted DNA-binding ribbon-helix-helix protein